MVLTFMRVRGEIQKNHCDQKFDNDGVNTFAETVLGFRSPKDIFGMYTYGELQGMFRNTYDGMGVDNGDDWNTEVI